MTACEQGKAIENRVDVCAQAGTVCRIIMTSKALRTEEQRSAKPEDATVGSAVRKYASAFAPAGQQRQLHSGDDDSEPDAETVSDDEPCWADPADE